MSSQTVCIVTHGGYPDPETVVSGNSVRAYSLASGLVEHGFRIRWLYPASLEPDRAPRHIDPTADISVDTYGGARDLHRRIDESSPAAVLVGYWELLEGFPERSGWPVIVDVVAPRILESLYETNRDVEAYARKLLRLYRRADLFLAGNERQRHFLLPWLILAGVDCRADVPVSTLPISMQPARAPAPRIPAPPWHFVTGGVDWPWRHSTPWIETIVRTLGELPEESARLRLLSGSYVYAREDAPGELGSWPSERVVSQPLLPYGTMSDLFATGCHVGIELADRNTEREYSQSFRALEFLRAGLPLVCNGYLELAAHVRRYDAGWVVDSHDDVAAVIRRIVAQPDVWAGKSANAIRLVEREFNCVTNTRALADFIRAPTRPALAERALLAGCDEESAPRGKSGKRRRRMILGRALERWAKAPRH